MYYQKKELVMEKEMLALAKLKEGEDKLTKFMEWMQSEEAMTERSKFAIPPKTIGAVTPDKGAVMFKVFVTDKEGMVNFVSGKNPATTAIFDECVEKTQLWDLSEVHI
jgi:hypothetical protein